MGRLSRNCPKPQRRGKNVHRPEEQEGQEEPSADHLLLYIYAVGGLQGGRVMVTVHVNGVALTMEIDTVAKTLVIGADLYDKYFAHISLRPTQDLVWGSTLKMRGAFLAHVTYNEQSAELPVCVVASKFPSLFGLLWMTKLRLDFGKLIPKILNVNKTGQDGTYDGELLAKLRTNFPHVFRSIIERRRGMCLCRGVDHSLHFCTDITKFVIFTVLQ